MSVERIARESTPPHPAVENQKLTVLKPYNQSIEIDSIIQTEHNALIEIAGNPSIPKSSDTITTRLKDIPNNDKPSPILTPNMRASTNTLFQSPTEPPLLVEPESNVTTSAPRNVL